MNDLLKTTIFAGVATGARRAAAIFSTRERGPQSAADFDDQGQPFFADFKDGMACTDLEVVEFEPSTATATRFRVMFKDKKWVIPSHYNYPADARDRLSQTAGALMGLTKDTIRSNNTDAQESMGVIDPLDSKVSTLKGRGKRITLRDASEKVLADIIIGNDIKGTERKDGTPQKYVRVPDQKRIYGVNIKAEPSTKFADWIETNLLKVEASKIRRILFDNYKASGRSQDAGQAGHGARRQAVDHPERRVRSLGDGRHIGGRTAQREQSSHAFRRGRGPEDRGDSSAAGGVEQPRKRRPQDNADRHAFASEQGFLLDASRALFRPRGRHGRDR